MDIFVYRYIKITHNKVVMIIVITVGNIYLNLLCARPCAKVTSIRINNEMKYTLLNISPVKDQFQRG